MVISSNRRFNNKEWEVVESKAQCTQMGFKSTGRRAKGRDFLNKNHKPNGDIEMAKFVVGAFCCPWAKVVHSCHWCGTWWRLSWRPLLSPSSPLSFLFHFQSPKWPSPSSLSTMKDIVGGEDDNKSYFDMKEANGVRGVQGLNGGCDFPPTSWMTTWDYLSHENKKQPRWA